MPTPQSPYDAVLHAARDVTMVDSALDAELLGAALLGSVYAIAETERAVAVREFVNGFVAHTARRRTTAARTIRAVFAALAPTATAAAKVRPGTGLPAWVPQLGQVRTTGTWAYGDSYGDQTSYLALFEYADPVLGGGDHAVVALVDHNLGIVKDVFVGQPGTRVLVEVQRAAQADDSIWVAEVEPARLRAEVEFYLDITDGLAALPEEGSLATDRALVGARLATLPAGGKPVLVAPPDPGELTREFLDSPAAADLDRSTPEADATVRYAVQLICDFGQDSPDGDPLRWSPAVAGLFLLDWLHRRAVLDAEDVAVLPLVLHAWTRWAGARRNLSAAAAAGITEAIETMAPEFVRLHGTGERRGPAVTAMAALIAAGVNPDDPAAVSAWLNQRLEAG